MTLKWPDFFVNIAQNQREWFRKVCERDVYGQIG